MASSSPSGRGVRPRPTSNFLSGEGELDQLVGSVPGVALRLNAERSKTVVTWLDDVAQSSVDYRSEQTANTV